MTTRNRPEAIEIAEELVFRVLDKFPITEEKKKSSTHYMMGQSIEMPPAQNCQIALDMIIQAANWLAGGKEMMTSDLPDLSEYFTA